MPIAFTAHDSFIVPLPLSKHFFRLVRGETALYAHRHARACVGDRLQKLARARWLPKGMLKYFEANSQIPEIAEVLTRRIQDHQRFILTTHCETPAVLGGDPL